MTTDNKRRPNVEIRCMNYLFVLIMCALNCILIAQAVKGKQKWTDLLLGKNPPEGSMGAHEAATILAVR